jgi:predicted anti-sigma-YlaC factor YlaD
MTNQVTLHFSEADLLETYYTQPGESMPVMMHLADCSECAARYERLERKLREAAACTTEKPATFWTRQRLQIMRRVDAQQSHAMSARRMLRVAAAAILSFFLGGAVVYESVKPAHQPPRIINIAPVAAQTAPAPSDIHDAWQSEELQDFHNVVEWEAWVPDNKTTPNPGSSL